MNSTTAFFLVVTISAGLGILALALNMLREERVQGAAADSADADPAAASAAEPAADPAPVENAAAEPVAFSAPTAADRSDDPPEAPSAVAGSAAAADAALEMAPPAPAATGGAASSLRSIATLFRDQDGKLLVAVDGRRYRHISEIDDEHVHLRLFAALDDLNRLLRPTTQDQPAAPAATSEAPRPAEPVAQPEPPESSDQPAGEPPEQPDPTAPTAQPDAPTAPGLAETEHLSQLSEPEPATELPAVLKLTVDEAAQLPLEKPSMNIAQQIRYLRQREASPKIEIKSMLEEIDEILQGAIVGTDWVKRGLRVSGAATSGTRFHLDGQVYDSIDDLPEPEAQAFVRSCIARWEQKH